MLVDLGVAGPQRSLGACGVLTCEARGVFESAGGFDRREDRVELCQASALDGLADERPLLFGPVPQRMDQRQRWLAFGEIVAEVLADRG